MDNGDAASRWPCPPIKYLLGVMIIVPAMHFVAFMLSGGHQHACRDWAFLAGIELPPSHAQVTEDFTALLLPSILAGVPREASPDFRAATLMILVQLAAQATLADSFLEGEPGNCQGCAFLHTVAACACQAGLFPQCAISSLSQSRVGSDGLSKAGAGACMRSCAPMDVATYMGSRC